jgi:hypothetical protein|tara:strand:+ start:619 stop:939 length:321 start_codon:yes stop_codon:yes gene_type:complete
MTEHDKAEITRELSEIILDVMPDAAMLDKYGGVIVERIAGEPKTHCCGYFVYAEHVSLEFSKGVLLSDPNSILEGKGKLRRHIKLVDVQDLEAKRCRHFLEQVANL